MIIVLNSFGPGFEMPKSAAAGGFTLAGINGTADVVFDQSFEESIVFSVKGSNLFDAIEVEYSEFNESISVREVNYYHGGERLWTIYVTPEDQDDFEPWTIDDLQSGRAFEMAVDAEFQFFGAVNRDVIYAGPGDNYVATFFGNDLISGDAGNDELYGGGSKDKVLGGSGNDLVSGADLHEGDLAKDSLYGNKGRDTFSFIKNCGSDTIKDFSRKNDRILLDDQIVASRSEIEGVARTYNKGVMLKFSNKEIIKIEDARLADLDKMKFDIQHFS